MTLDAVVVGSGPNGLSAAVALARKGLAVRVYEAAPSPGGGTRTEELTLPGYLHDVCSSVHPFGASSPFLQRLELERYGHRWAIPKVQLAHPLDGGRAAVLGATIESTADGLRGDAQAWRDTFGLLTRNWPQLVEGTLGPLVRMPRHPVLMAKFGFAALRPAMSYASARFNGEEARALFLGCAAHSALPLDQPFTASFGLMLVAAGHAVGWPFAEGGSASITRALATMLKDLGGEIICNERIATMRDLPEARAYLFDVTPRQLLEIAGERFNGIYRWQLGRYRYGAAVFKVDYALSGPVPWTASACADAGTVHVCGSPEEIEQAERAVNAGQAPERPFVIVAQASVADKTRAPEGKQTLWAYCHVPHGCTEDMTGRMEAQIERFAPGWRDLVLARHTLSPAQIAGSNDNYIGGDIAGGTHAGRQLLMRPFPRPNPYTTPDPAIFLCSSSTPPGAGVHGMCGFHAARAAWRRHFR